MSDNKTNNNIPTNVDENVQVSGSTTGTSAAPIVQLETAQLNIVVEEILNRVHSLLEAIVVNPPLGLPASQDRFRMLGAASDDANIGEEASLTGPGNENAATTSAPGDDNPVGTAAVTENNRSTSQTAEPSVGVDATVQAGACLRAVEARGSSSASNGGTADQIICPKCRTPVTLPPPELRWYSVWRGRRIGWVQNAERATKLTKGVPGQGIRYHATEDAARCHFVEKQHLKQAAVIDIENGEDISFVVGPWDGILFP
ncbi:hypothetical protein V5O48_010189 [Marasmius crinis-equi]|uniref:Uncharacterized protein n=1 Tax=Marasmius crinis-equi TaxID=585013 RepID=A0ABR3F927_9AGAR